MASLRKFTTTATADAAGDADESAVSGSYRSPMRVLRVDIDDSAAAGAGTASVEDEAGTTLASDDATTNLFTYDDTSPGTQHPGVLVAGPLHFILSGYTEDDVVSFVVFFDNG
jgi:hypothetical protein